MLALLIFHNKSTSQWKYLREWGQKIDVENDLMECRDEKNESVQLLLSLMIDIYETMSYF